MRFLAWLILAWLISSQWKEKSTRSTHPVTEGTYHFCSRGLGETIAFRPHLHAGKAKKFSAGQSAPVPSDHFITIEEGYSVLVSKLQSPPRPLILIFCPDSRKISSILRCIWGFCFSQLYIILIDTLFSHFMVYSMNFLSVNHIFGLVDKCYITFQL